MDMKWWFDVFYQCLEGSNSNAECAIPISEKPQPDGLALACQNHRPGQSHHKAINLAWPGLAYLGLAWLGSQPEARLGTALPTVITCQISVKVL